MKTLNYITNGHKARLVILVLIFGGSIAFAQSTSTNQKGINSEVKFKNIGITITVDSVKEIEDSFKVEDIKDILEKSGTNETVTFKIVCNSKNFKDNTETSTSYKIEGNTNEIKRFLNQVKGIRTAAINYYSNKK